MTPEERQQLDRIERKTNFALAGVALTLAIVLVLSIRVFGSDLSVAQADRETFPAAQRGYLYYASTASYPLELRDEATAILRFAVAMSSKQQVAELSIPVQISPTLHRLDMQSLEWDWKEWHRVLASYPYAVGATISPVTKQPLPLVVEAGWLVVQLTDTTVSDAHYRLLYGNVKLTRIDFLKFWGVNKKARSSFGIITQSESPIGPTVSGIRQLDNYPTNERGSAWGTRDSAIIDGKTDPLEHLQGDFRHDAEEWLVANPKLSSATGQRGILLAPLLSNAAGERVEEAPASIVTDHLGFRGQHAIRNVGSCVACHASGINPPSNNSVRDLIVSGVQVYAKKDVQAAIEAFHLSDSGTQIKRDNEDFAAGLLMVNGLTGEANALAFKEVVEFYDRSVNLGQASVEIGCTVDELRLAIAYASNQGYKLPARLAALAHAESMPRTAWEGTNYRTAQIILEAYRR